jgi:hypothetical protein
MTTSNDLSEHDFESRLLSKLTEVVNERPVDRVYGRERRLVPFGRRTVAAIAALALAVGFAVFLPLLITPNRTGPQASALTLLPDGRVMITLEDLNDGEALIRGLQAEGIEASIAGRVYASPGNVGKVESYLDLPQDGTPGFSWSPDSRLPVYINPDLFHGPISINIGVPTPAGQDYSFSESVFDHGEALAGLQCSLGVPMSAANLAVHAEAAGFSTIVWETTNASPIPPTSDLVAQGDVIDASPTNASTLEVRVAAPRDDVRPLYSSNDC